ncbi:MAG: hypothetical protein DME65_11500 [Verrucomicrobia bacterium]|nr:MAG: hypothetical protein DME65_11500 [Verrucomicrobiota bacterium]
MLPIMVSPFTNDEIFFTRETAWRNEYSDPFLSDASRRRASVALSVEGLAVDTAAFTTPIRVPSC